jgi:hypothetical protein
MQEVNMIKHPFKRLVLLSTAILSLGSLSAAASEVLKPHSTYAEQLVEEVTQKATEDTHIINLQNNPLIFASKQKIFEPLLAGSIVKAILSKCPHIEIVDLSLNRLPEEALGVFVELLIRKDFKYLDISVNSGANSLDGLRQLTTILGAQGVPLESQIAVLKKVIWVPEAALDSMNEDLPDSYKAAHRAYYREKLRKSWTGWKLPTE